MNAVNENKIREADVNKNKHRYIECAFPDLSVMRKLVSVMQ